MKRFYPYSVGGVSLLSVAAIVSIAIAQTGEGFDLSWNTIDGGGGTSTGGSFSLSGSAGQCDAGSLTGGSYTLIGGFWGGAAGVGTCPPCGYDLNGDNVVDQLDLLLLIRYVEVHDPCGDLNCDEEYDAEDFFVLSLHWWEVLFVP
jgi:hypothetical protein